MHRPSAEQVRALDPYRLLGRAGPDPGEQLLDIGCGVGTTAIRIARQFGAASPMSVSRPGRSR